MPQFKVRTCLWFEKDGLEAAKFYVSLLPNSQLDIDPGMAEPIMVPFTLYNVPYLILNGGPHFRLSEAASIYVSTKDQSETDRLWHTLTTNGGQEGRCGWLKDRWGVSWQIIPEDLPKLLGATDREAAGRAQKAMMEMTKIDMTKLRDAYEKH